MVGASGDGVLAVGGRAADLLIPTWMGGGRGAGSWELGADPGMLMDKCFIYCRCEWVRAAAKTRFMPDAVPGHMTMPSYLSNVLNSLFEI